LISRLPGSERSYVADNGMSLVRATWPGLVVDFSDGGESAVIDQGIPTRAPDPTEHLDDPRAAVTRYQAS